MMGQNTQGLKIKLSHLLFFGSISSSGKRPFGMDFVTPLLASTNDLLKFHPTKPLESSLGADFYCQT